MMDGGGEGEAWRDMVAGRSKAARVGHVRRRRWCAATGGGPIVGGKPRRDVRRIRRGRRRSDGDDSLGPSLDATKIERAALLVLEAAARHHLHQGEREARKRQGDARLGIAKEVLPTVFSCTWRWRRRCSAMQGVESFASSFPF